MAPMPCTAPTERTSWLPLLVRGAVTPKGFIGVTERIFVRTTVALRSAYLVPHDFPPCFRRRGDTYPFSFVTKRKGVRRCRKVFTTPTFSLALFTSAIKALVCPFAVLRSRFGLRYSRVRGRRQSKFLAASATGGARKPNPSGEGHRPLAVRSDSPLWQYPIKMCRHGRHT